MLMLIFWGLRSQAAALRFGARYSLGPSAALPLRSGLRPPLHIARPNGPNPLNERLTKKALRPFFRAQITDFIPLLTIA